MTFFCFSLNLFLDDAEFRQASIVTVLLKTLSLSDADVHMFVCRQHSCNINA